jgi:hypothetical protein
MSNKLLTSNQCRETQENSWHVFDNFSIYNWRKSLLLLSVHDDEMRQCVVLNGVVLYSVQISLSVLVLFLFEETIF